MARPEEQAKKLERLSFQLEVERWKLASMQRRRWWRIGSELNQARQHPRTLIRLPWRLLKAAATKPESLPRPIPPRQRDTPLSDSLRQLDNGISAPPRLPVPRYETTVLAHLRPELLRLISHSVRAYELHPHEMTEQLASISPGTLLLDDSAVSAMPAAQLADFLDKAKSTGIRCVWWLSESSSLEEGLSKRMDAVLLQDARPLPDFNGRQINVQGLIEPRLQNPIGASRRSDSARMDSQGQVVGSSTYPSLMALSDIAKRFKVLRSVGPIAEDDLVATAATGTPVIVNQTTANLGITASPPEDVAAMEQSLLSSETLRSRLAHADMRRAMREFSIAPHIAEAANVEPTTWPTVDVMVATKRPERVDWLFANLSRQTYPDFRVFLVTHGVSVEEAALRELAERDGVRLESVIHVPEDVLLGEVFNIGFGETDAEVVAKIDDDDYYGPEYLWDLFSALDFSGAEVAGKWAHYAYLEGLDATIYRFPKHEHRFTELVAISTLLMRREVFDYERFPAMPWGSGSVFLRALGAHGARVFAADRWNYLYMRGRGDQSNTYPMSDWELMSTSTLVCRGRNTEEVEA